MARTHEQKARHAQRERERRAANPEKHRAAVARWRKKNPDYARNYQQNLHLTNPDAYQRQREAAREWKANNRKWVREYMRRYRAGRRSEVVERLPLGEGLKNTLMTDALYVVVNNAVPKTYDNDTRDDIITDIIIDVLDNKLKVEDITANVKRYVTAYWRGRDTHRTVSFDPVKHEMLTMFEY